MREEGAAGGEEGRVLGGFQRRDISTKLWHAGQSGLYVHVVIMHSDVSTDDGATDAAADLHYRDRCVSLPALAGVEGRVGRFEWRGTGIANLLSNRRLR